MDCAGQSHEGEEEHRIPLSQRTVAILTKLAETRSGEYVFPGQRHSRPLSNDALLALIRRMGRSDITAHGFRSAFSDWASEVSSFSAELRETALAHVVSNKAEAAYRRGDALEKRRAMMEAWANFCEPKAGSNVIQFGKSNSPPFNGT
jgi:integrase